LLGGGVLGVAYEVVPDRRMMVHLTFPNPATTLYSPLSVAHIG
jgi:hypothetical protein